MNTKVIRTIEMPQEIFKSMVKVYQTWEDFSDDFEDFALSIDEDFLEKMRRSKKEHLKGRTRSLGNLKEELKIQ